MVSAAFSLLKKDSFIILSKIIKYCVTIKIHHTHTMRIMICFCKKTLLWSGPVGLHADIGALKRILLYIKTVVHLKILIVVKRVNW